MKQISKSAKMVMLMFVLSAPIAASAHDDDNNWHGGGNWNGGGGGRNVPLDGGLSLLLVAGVGYGIKRYAQSKKADK